jgi:glycosyltransferase involved in cell wall biosynthesis
VCPVVWHFPDLSRAVPFLRVIADIIDDQRSWQVAASYKARLDESYRKTLERADIVFANCAAAAEAFADYADPIQIVPNGTERFDEIPETAAPPSVSALKRPIIGYAGNLRDRIDWDLLSTVAAERPNWSLVLAGSSNDNPSAQHLARFPNVTLLGVVEYPRLLSYLRAFDVGIVPHVNNSLTEKMNPLKLYNYFGAGIPIVSTEVANLDDLKPYIRTASDPDSFITAIEACLAEPASFAAAERERVLTSISWEARVAEILAVIDCL